MFRIKICGITNPEDALLAVEAGADAIGLNFYHASRRCVMESTARSIIDVVPDQVACVGVFVNQSAAEVTGLAERLKLDWIQLHGDEPPGMVAELGRDRVIRALPCGPGGGQQIGNYMQQCRESGAMPAAILADAAAGNAYGGTGRMAQWEELVSHRVWLGGVPLILAGGLNAGIIAAAIQTVRPDAVDTASGVESSPGRKDAQRMREFVKAAQGAFLKVGPHGNQ